VRDCQQPGAETLGVSAWGKADVIAVQVIGWQIRAGRLPARPFAFQADIEHAVAVRHLVGSGLCARDAGRGHPGGPPRADAAVQLTRQVSDGPECLGGRLRRAEGIGSQKPSSALAGIFAYALTCDNPERSSGSGRCATLSRRSTTALTCDNARTCSSAWISWVAYGRYRPLTGCRSRICGPIVADWTRASGGEEHQAQGAGPVQQRRRSPVTQGATGANRGSQCVQIPSD
jgi:hypothetical protein